jgi:hypothetical protein
MHAASIGQFLNKLEYSDKKKSLVAIEQRRACVKKQRRNWFRRPLAAMRQHPDRLVFIDQTSVKTKVTRHMRTQFMRKMLGNGILQGLFLWKTGRRFSRISTRLSDLLVRLGDWLR